MSNTILYEDLIKKFHPMIYKICRVYSSSEDFDDLYQEVLINLWKSYGSFQGRSKLSTWVYRLVLNTALTYQRNNKKSKSSSLGGSQMAEAVEDLEAAHEKERQINKLYNAIGQLAKNERSIVLLYLEEKTYEEIAEITGLKISNVGVKINRVKKKLFKILNSIEDER